MFIIAILVTTILKHQVFLLQTQDQINEQRTAEILVQSGNALMNFPHPSHWWQAWEAGVQKLPEGRYFISAQDPNRLTVCTEKFCVGS
jgi:hypothetical protein